jgi:anti-sigma-K factor RskA
VDRLAALESSVHVLTEVVSRVEHRLFGNGQPGELSALKSRITKLENWRWYVCGIAVGLGAFAGWIGRGVLLK